MLLIFSRSKVTFAKLAGAYKPGVCHVLSKEICNYDVTDFQVIVIVNDVIIENDVIVQNLKTTATNKAARPNVTQA